MKLICTKYTRQGGPGATYNGKRLTDGAVELVDGNNLLNRIYVDRYGHTNYEGDEWSDKLYDEFIVSPTERYRKNDTAPIALKEKTHWFESGDLTQDKLREKNAKETALATIKAFKDSICEENASIIKDYYKDKFKSAKADYEKELARLYDSMKGALNSLLPYAKLNEKDFKGFSAPKCVYGRNAKQFSKSGDEMTNAKVGDIVTKGFDGTERFRIKDISNGEPYLRVYTLVSLDTGKETRVHGSGSVNYIIK